MWNATIHIMLQPLDLLVALKLTVREEGVSSLEALSQEVGISTSSAFRAIKRATQAGLVTGERKPKRGAILEFVIHGVRYVYYVTPGSLTRGVPTAHAAPPLSTLISASTDIPVWPDPKGDTRGYAIEPLHKQAPVAARKDPKLYELLALVDAIRIGRARERNIAAEELRQRIRP
jgi:hypothetical protein